ncbi:helix-turn-helix transcriptional regulator [Aquimarina sp. U1-2]|uniref:helix-turn-helix domain-containing protein n=1 Tax=Aquimarina sp. U1-2 TaxID=2823141 RepID=UPI001AECDC56|nr:response regulator transcription factor [Aquimarina sp. U1-2]MBP2833213.1 helix-turn-helix transcriptional regulator [Aquimarina sp. U1-2]
MSDSIVGGTYPHTIEKIKVGVMSANDIDLFTSFTSLHTAFEIVPIWNKYVWGDYFKDSMLDLILTSYQNFQPFQDMVDFVKTLDPEIAIPSLMQVTPIEFATKHSLIRQFADEILLKPFTADDLTFRIQKVISAHIARAAQPKKSELCQQIDLIIERNIANLNLSVALVASELGMSPKTLCRKIKGNQDKKVNPVQYILQKRLEYAARLLSDDPHIQITDVALQTGFMSLSYFSKAFKQQYGQLPSTYKASKLK